MKKNKNNKISGSIYDNNDGEISQKELLWLRLTNSSNWSVAESKGKYQGRSIEICHQCGHGGFWKEINIIGEFEELWECSYCHAQCKIPLKKNITIRKINKNDTSQINCKEEHSTKGNITEDLLCAWLDCKNG